MDRERIERRDFPTGRRGYDPAAVDEHLRRVADEFEAHLSAPRASLADSTSEQVRLILDAAERGADELAPLPRAGEQSVGPTSPASRPPPGRMLSKLDALERPSWTRLCSAPRCARAASTSRRGSREPQAQVSGGVCLRRRRPGSPPDPAPPVAASPRPTRAVRDRRRRGRRTPGAPPAPDLGRSKRTSPASADAGARLIALNMALSGTPREETARYLAEHFELDDPDALLDDVYARAGR